MELKTRPTSRGGRDPRLHRLHLHTIGGFVYISRQVNTARKSGAVCASVRVCVCVCVSVLSMTQVVESTRWRIQQQTKRRKRSGKTLGEDAPAKEARKITELLVNGCHSWMQLNVSTLRARPSPLSPDVLLSCWNRRPMVLAQACTMGPV